MSIGALPVLERRTESWPDRGPTLSLLLATVTTEEVGEEEVLLMLDAEERGERVVVVEGADLAGRTGSVRVPYTLSTQS